MGHIADKGALEERNLVSLLRRCLFICVLDQCQLYLTCHRNDAKTVSIVSLGCYHPNIKVQSASLHFFLGVEEAEEESESEGEDVRHVKSTLILLLMVTQVPDVKGVLHRREINKKTRSGDKKIRKQLKSIKIVCPGIFHPSTLPQVMSIETKTSSRSCVHQFSSDSTST